MESLEAERPRLRTAQRISGTDEPWISALLVCGAHTLSVAAAMDPQTEYACADVRRPPSGRSVVLNGGVVSDSVSLSADAPPQTNGRDGGRRKIRACSPDQGRQ